MILSMIIKLATSQCPVDNYSPCYCVAPSYSWDDVDFQVTYCNAAFVYKIMKSQCFISPANADAIIEKLLLIPREQDRYIPTNLLGNRNDASLIISCHLQNTKSNYLNLDQDAFGASKYSLNNEKLVKS